MVAALDDVIDWFGLRGRVARARRHLMSNGRARALQHSAILVSMLGIASAAHAAGWFDDFNDGDVKDGNPVTWLEDLGGSGLFPGDYDASSGDYVLTPAADGTDESIMLSLVPSVTFTDTYVRTQGIVLPDPNDPENDGGNLVLLGRVDPEQLNGYIVYFDVSGNLNLQVLFGGVGTDIGTTFDAPFNASSEVVVELNIVGDQLSAFAWLADDPNGKPAEPQVTAVDTTYTTGVAGIVYAEDDDNTFGIFRYATAQDTPFVDSLPGDFNVDGKVDAADYVHWRNGPADPADYQIWSANFGTGLSASSQVASVPEPAGWLLALLAITGLRRWIGGRGSRR
jgi:hypothetical protein